MHVCERERQRLKDISSFFRCIKSEWICIIWVFSAHKQSLKQKIPDVLGKSLSCLTDRRWDRFLDARMPWTIEDKCERELSVS